MQTCAAESMAMYTASVQDDVCAKVNDRQTQMMRYQYSNRKSLQEYASDCTWRSCASALQMHVYSELSLFSSYSGSTVQDCIRRSFV